MAYPGHSALSSWEKSHVTTCSASTGNCDPPDDDTPTDSAAGATAMATGRKVFNGVCSVALPGDGSDLETALEAYKNQGKKTGLVTTDDITEATPACFGAHTNSRNNRREIAEQLCNQSMPHVLFGQDDNDISGIRQRCNNYDISDDLDDFTRGDQHVLGLFSGSRPTLAQRLEKALELLDNPNGFFLMVEHEGPDTFGHAGDLGGTVCSVLELRDAVDVAVAFANSQPNDNTLIVVTADHETGGLQLDRNDGGEMQSCPNVVNMDGTMGVRGTVPRHEFTAPPGCSGRRCEHTNIKVPLFATGPFATNDFEPLPNMIDNTDVRQIISPSIPPPEYDCNAASAIRSGRGDDNLVGTRRDDIICGFGGHDTINGHGGNDCIDGGGGNDRISGGRGNDRIFGKSGGDDLQGGADDDRIDGGPGRDHIDGNGGDDRLSGNGGNDDISGAGGADRIAGGNGDDDLKGGGGRDRIAGGNGNDILQGSAGNDVLRGEDGRDVLLGSNGNDELRGGRDNDVLLGGSDDDILRGGGGQDVCLGGSGTDSEMACEQIVGIP